MARVRLATRSVSEPLCSLSSWCSSYRLVLPSGFGEFITLGTDGFPGGSGWSWLSSCRALAVGTRTCQALLLPWDQELNWQICASQNQTVLVSQSWDALGYQPGSPARSLFLTSCQLGLWPSLSLGSQFPVFSLSSSSSYICGRWGSCAKLSSPDGVLRPTQDSCEQK